jgi:DNA-binding XRE family transcriptional regulator
MNGLEFKAWREHLGITQAETAAKLGVRRATIQNWESGATPIPKTAEMAIESVTRHVRQMQRNFGPVALFYADGPIAMSPFGSGRMAQLHREPYPTNAAALERVLELWGRADFVNPFIVDEKGDQLWVYPELDLFVAGADGYAEAPFGAHELLAILDQDGRYIAHEMAFPLGDLKGEEISLREGDGRYVGVPTERGFRSDRLTIRRDLLEYLIRAQLIAQIKDEGDESTLIYRITAAGSAIAKAQKPR